MMRLRRPSWFALALTLVGVAVFVRLGFWQLHRADEKEALLRLFAAAAQAPVEDFAAVAGRVAPERYPHVRVPGRFVPQRDYLLDDQVVGGQVGVRVFAPFLPDAGGTLLVNLGFLPRQGAQRRLPELPPLPSGATTLTGLYAPPPPAGLKLGGDALPHETRWPKLTIYLDLEAVGADLGRRLYPRVLLLDRDPASPYVRLWTPDVMPPARHLGYALQWFSFAIAAVVIFLALHRRRESDEEPQ